MAFACGGANLIERAAIVTAGYLEAGARVFGGGVPVYTVAAACVVGRKGQEFYGQCD